MEAYKLYIDGKWVEPLAGAYFDTFSPATGELIAKVAEGTRDDAQVAIEAARRGFERISSMSVWERSRLLASIASVIEKRKEELAHTLTLDQGKPYLTEALSEVEGTITAFLEAAEQMKCLETSVISVEDSSKRVFTIRQPKGVYAIITPWNFPYTVPAEYIAYGLAAGNAIVWAPAPSTSVCAVKLAECLDEAGVPKGVVNLVTGQGAVVGDEIVAHPGTDAIGFTGSTATGNQIAVRGAGKPLLLELGGNGPTIVLEDADLDRAAQSIAMGCFLNAGQVCTATELILVHENVHDELVKRLLKYAKEVVLGDPFDSRTTMGPLNNELVVQKNEQHAQDCLQKGAQILIGGRRAPNMASNLFFEPTVIVGVTEECLYSLEETFGPVAPVMSFSTNEEALELAAKNKWGLVSSVFTANLKDAFYFAEQLKAGVVTINSGSCEAGGSNIPFGGVAGKQSGIGKIGGKYALYEMTDLKAISIDVR
ncbi:aldehyde dehydrogenase [Brevibacillus fluminis]|uniref:3-sulfolactaldehyde dehydrogenase n=1 Tax=Brevibacillus fluminis TaxID=511487 RepID=A0A3M8DJ35_9BACL|nr:aldehyde dehydrogenase family protein [Brevibacillus fluminis]RNB87137.1 aldehyde dehydrogenase [Brevibacillus fluminis]